MNRTVFALKLPRDAGHSLVARLLPSGECRISVHRDGKELPSHRVTLRRDELGVLATLLEHLAEAIGAETAEAA